MEKPPKVSQSLENLSDDGLAALRARVSELAADLPGTLANLPPEVQKEYRDAEKSVIYARDIAPFREGLNPIL